jgi:hypothetical protein
MADVDSVAAPKKQKVNWKRLSITILIVALAVSATAGPVWYFMDQANKINQDTITSLQSQLDKTGQVEDKEENDDKEDGSDSKVIYEDERYNFRLTFSDAWKDYGVSYTLFEDSDAQTIYFGLPAKETKDYIDFGFDKNYGSIFAISVYPKAEWDSIQEEDGPKPAKIDEKNGLVYAYSTGNGIPGVKAISDDKVYDEALDVIDTFEFVD